MTGKTLCESSLQLSTKTADKVLRHYAWVASIIEPDSTDADRSPEMGQATCSMATPSNPAARACMRDRQKKRSEVALGACPGGASHAHAKGAARVMGR